ncbi:MAG: hypothetical protein AAF417_19895 [Pseudomonadota bacterium]
MNRRQLIGAAIALPVAASVPLAASATGVRVPFELALYEAALKDGRPFMLDFYASW